MEEMGKSVPQEESVKGFQTDCNAESLLVC